MHKRLHHSGHTFGAALLIAVLGAPVPVTAQNTSLSPDSDGGGTTFSTLSCGANRVLMAVSGRSGMWTDRVQGVCVQITADGRWIGSETTTSSSPGTSGNPFSLRCPPNHAVTGLVGRSGNWVDRLAVRCKPLTNGGALSGSAVLARTSSNETAVGGSGGSSFGPTDCASNVPARGIIGQSGSVPTGASYVDQIGLNCGMPTPFRISGMTLSPNPATGPGSVSGTISFNRAAPANFSVSLTSNNTTVASPSGSSVSVSAGATSAPFTVSTTNQGGCATITASHAGSISNGGLIVHPPSVGSAIALTVPQTVFVGVTTQTGTVRGSPGTVVALSSSQPNLVSVPASVTLPRTATRSAEAQFAITPMGMSSGCATISATSGTTTIRRTVQSVFAGG